MRCSPTDAGRGGGILPRMEPSDPRRFAPATQRNRDPILAVLRRVLPRLADGIELALSIVGKTIAPKAV